MKTVRILTGLALLLSAGPVAALQAPATANLIVLNAPETGPRSRGTVQVAVYGDATCDGEAPRERKAQLNLGLAEDWKQLTIPAATPVWIEIRTGEFVPEGTRMCVTVITFAPTAGHTYRLTQALTRPGCQPAVKDDATSASPPGLQVIPTAGKCGK